jgi:predicted glycosyltransferase
MNLNLFVTSFIKKTGADLTPMEIIQIRNWLKIFIKESIMFLKSSDMKKSVKEELLEKFSDSYFHPDEKKFIKELGIDEETYFLLNPEECSPVYEEDC